jgi:hypothetical protein
MKKYSFLAFAVLAGSLSFAQDDAAIVIKGTGATKITKELTPQQVIDSLEKRFPDAKSIEYFKVKPDAAQKGWDISEEYNMDASETVEYYTIKFKRQDMKYYGLYAADGRLIQSKLEESSRSLPEPVKASLMELSKQYPGYKLVSKNYYKNIKHAKSEEYYEVVASNGKNQKIIYYSPDGTIIKTKDK